MIQNLQVQVSSKKLKTEGQLIYEYSPFKNFRIKEEKTIDDQVIKKNSVVNLDTNLLNFDLEHPIEMIPQWSYDDSTNLVITQDNDYPKLINSRFSITSKNGYKIVDRKGTNDTNIYDEEYFEEDTALYKNTIKIPKVEFQNTTNSGNLKIGNYHFYFRYCDDDGNLSNFFAESGTISIFIGETPQNICTGFANQNSYKGVLLKLTNLDEGYSYIEVYYSKSSSDINENAVITYHKIDLKFSINTETVTLFITGYENIIDVTVEDINPVYLTFEGVNTQAVALNMLFFGNIILPNIKYEQLQKLSYNIYPSYNTENYDISNKIKNDYRKKDIKNSYYDPKFIYDKTGYWPGEIYRFGIVYIFKNNVLSPVFNIRGGELKTTWEDNYTISDDSIQFNQDTFFVLGEHKYENIKGVVSIPNLDNSNKIYYINFNFQEDLESKLKKLGVIGYFFVRLKRIPTTLCQAFTIGVDVNSHVPAIPFNDKFVIEGFLLQDDTTNKEYVTKFNLGKIAIAIGIAGLINPAASIQAGIAAGILGRTKELKKNQKTNISYLTHEYLQHMHIIGQADINIGAICPEYDVNFPYFNSLFTGSEFPVRVLYDINLQQENWNKRSYFSQEQGNTDNKQPYVDTKIIGVEDNTKLVAIGDTYFSARAGEAEEATRYEYIGYENKISEATNLVRGSFGPYIGTTLDLSKASKLIEIKIPKYSELNISDYFGIRMHDASSYFAITDRKRLDESVGNVYRGDCYICQYTHRVNRNFNDPVAPFNDKILDPKCWKENFKMKDGVIDTKNIDKINLGDLNAVKMGQWVTFVLRSNFNLNVRSIDESNIEEKHKSGIPRGFFPYQEMLVSGNSKIPEALCINKGFLKGTSERFNFEVPDVPAIKDEFSTRISYSNINTAGSFINGFRIFDGNSYQDYPKTYGGITKLINFNENLLVIFEHGVGVIAVNEKAAVANSISGEVYINSDKVLSDNINILTDSYGSQWKDSIIKTDKAVYGIDTVAKKIWQTDGTKVVTISDFKVQSFLNYNIPLGVNDLAPKIGYRNVKSHYNAFKDEVMFTFRDTKITENNKLQEVIWNLCYNLQLLTFTTFYSWFPEFSENIDNIFFTIDYPQALREQHILSNIDGDTTDEPSIEDPNEESILKSIRQEAPKCQLWKHGTAGLFKSDKIYPTKWYDKLHPFEIEFAVNTQSGVHKIFDNLLIIGNSAEPESFHYEIVGDSYSFANDKKNMYIRQELTKQELAQSYDIEYDEDYVDLIPMKNEVSTIFPQYYGRENSKSEIEDYYHLKDGQNTCHFSAMTGSEIVHDKILNEYRIWTHAKAEDVATCGRRLGNMFYKEDKWHVQINPINLILLNEPEWDGNPPIVNKAFTYLLENTDDEIWNNAKESEVKIKDKWIKIRIRYSGEKLAVINAVVTLFSESQS